MKLVENDSQRLKIGINILVMILALITFTTQEINLKQTSLFERFMIDRLSRLQESITSAKDSVVSIMDNYIFNINASVENKKLQADIEHLKNKLFEFNEIEKENLRLTSLLRFSERISQDIVIARIVGRDSSSDAKMLRINKGSTDGITLLAPVVTSDGVVGYIYRITNHFSDVLTILDPNNRLDAIVERTRSHGIVEGYTDDRVLMKYVTRTEPIILNDLIITSGLGMIYPKGLKIGKVSRIERESYGITQHVEIEPSVNFNTIEEVSVIKLDLNSNIQDEWNELDNNSK